METRLNYVVDEAARLAESIFGGYAGDMLNPVNACTGIAVYLSEEHPVFDSLAAVVSGSPRGSAADLQYDTLLRFSALAMLGKVRVGPPDRVIRSLLRRLEPSRRIVRQLTVDHLLDVWRQSPESLCFNQFSTFLFGQYVSRLVSRCGVDVPEDERHAITDQISRYLRELLAPLTKGQASVLHLPLIESQLLLGASAVALLGDLDTACTFVSHALQIQELLERSLSARDGEDLVSALVEHDRVFDSLCFVGLNAHVLRPWFGPESERMRDLVRRCLVPTLGTSEYDVSDLRRISLRLAGLRCVVSDRLARQVATEFIAVSELDTFRQIRKHLKQAVDDWVGWRTDLEEKGFDVDAITPQTLYDLVNRITFTRFGHVRGARETLQTEKGDCKSIATLAATILLKAGIAGNLCLFYGQDVARCRGASDRGSASSIGPLENHVFVEWWDQDTRKRIPIDHDVGLGQMKSFIKDKRHLVRYPIHSLVVEPDEEEMFALLAEKRAEVRVRLRRKSS